MRLDNRDGASLHSAAWISIGFRFGIGFFIAMIVVGALSLVIWLGTLKLLKHVNVEETVSSAASSIEHTLDSVPHPALPQPAKSRSFKVDPHDRDMCLKLSGGVVNQQLLECMQENSATPSP